MVRKYLNTCCDGAELHCAFCSIFICLTHVEDVEVEGHIFQACEDCATSLRDRRPGKHEHCTCHDEEYCEHHDNVGSIG